MAELSDFLPYVRRQISGPLNIMMTDALSMAAVAFSRQSLGVPSGGYCCTSSRKRNRASV